MYIRPFIVGLSLLLLGACVTTPIAESHEHVTKDGKHWAVQVTMHTGVYGSPVQTIMVMYNRYDTKPVAVVSGQTKTLSGELVDKFLELGPAIVAGQYLIRATEIDCPPGTLCGTLVQVQNSAGANADSTATATGS